MNKLAKKVYPFLTFGGNAEEAVNFYIDIIPDSKVLSLVRIGEHDRGETGKILNCVFELSGQEYVALDIEKEYAVKFSWAFSMYFECPDENEFDTIFSKLSDGGNVIMGPEPVESEHIKMRKATWITDKFGVTWQLVWV